MVVVFGHDSQEIWSTKYFVNVFVNDSNPIFRKSISIDYDPSTEGGKPLTIKVFNVDSVGRDNDEVCTSRSKLVSNCKRH